MRARPLVRLERVVRRAETWMNCMPLLVALNSQGLQAIHAIRCSSSLTRRDVTQSSYSTTPTRNRFHQSAFALKSNRGPCLLPQISWTSPQVRSMTSLATASSAAPADTTPTKIGARTKQRHIDKDPFAPSVTVKPSTTARDSPRDVTHPHLPDLFDPAFLDKLLPSKPRNTKQEHSTQRNAFMDALDTEANKQYTQNAAHAFASTGSPLVDAFNGLSQATAESDYEPLLRKAWEVDPLSTLKIIFNLRSIHEGKSEREGFYRAWGWLYRNHPRTAILNLGVLVEPLIEHKLRSKPKAGDNAEGVEDDAVLVEMEDVEGESEQSQRTIRGKSHGYWKDPLNLLILAAEGNLDDGVNPFSALHSGRFPAVRSRSAGHRTRPTTKQNISHPTKESVQESVSGAKSKRAEVSANYRAKLEDLLRNSKPFQALYIAVARLFADALEADVKILQRIADAQTPDDERINLSFQLSFAAKYAPSLAKSHDRRTNIASAIAELLCERGKLPVQCNSFASPLSIQQVHDLREAYIRWVVSPLRRFMQIPEIFMSSNRWDELPYNLVASKCMQTNKKHFDKHDKERFSKYLLDVASGKRNISGATLLPHTLLIEALRTEGGAESQVIEAQWKTIVDTLRESGALDNSLAVCDVSGSMGSVWSVPRHDAKSVSPIFPAIALSIVLAQISRPPWSNRFITFSANPQIAKIDPTAGLRDIAKEMSTADWGMNTDFNAVFTKLILPMAKEHKVPKEDMIRRLFVFSDMEFDRSAVLQSDTGRRDYARSESMRLDLWKTEHERIAEAFAEAGYDVPEIVYWNLQGAAGAKPVRHDWEGVGVMSGFSSNMLKVFMETGSVLEDEEEVEVEEGGEDGQIVSKKEKKKMTPEDVMNKSLNKPSFATLKVED